MVRFTHKGPQSIVMECEVGIEPGTHDNLIRLAWSREHTVESVLSDAVRRGLDVLKREAEEKAEASQKRDGPDYMP